MIRNCSRSDPTFVDNVRSLPQLLGCCGRFYWTYIEPWLWINNQFLSLSRYWWKLSIAILLQYWKRLEARWKIFCCWPFIGILLTHCWPFVDPLLTLCWPFVGPLFTFCWPFSYPLLTDLRDQCTGETTELHIWIHINSVEIYFRWKWTIWMSTAMQQPVGWDPIYDFNTFL